MSRDLTDVKHHILICNSATCMRHQGEQVTQAIRDEIARHGAEGSIHGTRTRCNGRVMTCVTIVYPDGHWYRHVTPDFGRETYLQGAMPFVGLSLQFTGRHFVSIARSFD